MIFPQYLELVLNKYLNALSILHKLIQVILFLKLIHLFYLEDNYSIVMVFVMQQHESESVTIIHVSPRS